MDSVLAMIGLARRAGKVSSGAEIAESMVKKGKAKLIIIAEDISENGKKAITDACKYYKVRYIEHADKIQLGRAVGSDIRTVISVNDKGFSRAILKKYDEFYAGRND